MLEFELKERKLKEENNQLTTKNQELLDELNYLKEQFNEVRDLLDEAILKIKTKVKIKHFL